MFIDRLLLMIFCAPAERDISDCMTKHCTPTERTTHVENVRYRHLAALRLLKNSETTKAQRPEAVFYKNPTNQLFRRLCAFVSLGPTSSFLSLPGRLPIFMRERQTGLWFLAGLKKHW